MELNNDEEEQRYAYAMQLATSHVLPMVLQAAVQLEVLEIISSAGPGAKLSAPQIAARIPAQKNPAAADMLDRMLRLLASYSVLTCSVVDNNDGDGRVVRSYGLAPVGKYFVRDDEGVSLGPFVNLIQDPVFVQSWSQFKDSILEGGVPFDRVHGTHAFEYPSKDPRFNEVFNQAMINHTTLVVKQILKVYKGFESLETLVDVGGGLGITLNKIISKYPTIKGINFDLPHVIKHAKVYTGIEHVGGDMFQSVPRGDAIFMKWILHDWRDEQCVKLLKNCHKALPDNGKVIIVEGILPLIPDSSSSVINNVQMDIMMMTQNPGGKERTEDEFLDLANAAGFSTIKKQCFVSNFWVVEFHK